jgi:lysophospholipase L1-like esterase
MKPASAAILALASVLALALPCPASEAPSSFALHDGDRVVFYGDSITQDGGYGSFVEEYCRTRYPHMNLRFYNAGVGGDTVRGGISGPIGLRLDRDLFRHKPTVVTIMLGMNDGGYRKLEPATLAAFSDGYRSIVSQIRKSLPDARIYLIRSSPFDDVARPPEFDPGYMDVLRTMGDAVESIAREYHATVVDFGGAVSEGLRRAVANNPGRAHHLLPDRVHPSPAGHILMGATLLRAFGAAAEVSRVEIDAKEATVRRAEFTSVSGLKVQGRDVSWDQLDAASPLPLNFKEANVELAQIAGADLESLDSEPLSVSGLPEGRYTLQIDDRVLGQFSQSELERGVNLAVYDTPMRWSAYQVLWSAEAGRSMQLLERSLRFHAGSDTAAIAAADYLLARDESDQSGRSALAVPVPHHVRVQPVR